MKRAGETCERHGRDGPSVAAAPTVIARIGTKRRAGRHTQGEWRGERITEQRLQHDPCRGERRTDDGPRQHARHTREEEICASTLSANGIDRSNTREKLIDVLPTSGASRHVASVRVPYTSSVNASRVRIGRERRRRAAIADSEVDHGVRLIGRPSTDLTRS